MFKKSVCGSMNGGRNRNSFIYRFFILVIIFILAGCSQYDGKNEKSFVFSYEMNSIEPEHEEVIGEWLAKAN